MTSPAARGTLAALVMAALACRAPAPPPAPAPTPATPRVAVESPSGRSSAVRVEVARTPAELERGLMFRERLGSDEGMLFVFPETAVQSFWMKNTLIPLDMIFADADGVVVGVVERAEPMTTVPRSVGVPSRYVLEVNAGWSAAHGVSRGDRLRLENVAR